MIHIVLCCAAAMSTSLLVEKMKLIGLFKFCLEDLKIILV